MDVGCGRTRTKLVACLAPADDDDEDDYSLDGAGGGGGGQAIICKTRKLINRVDNGSAESKV